MRQFLFLFIFAFASALSITAQTQVTVKDGDLVGGQTYNWTKDKVYVLDGFVFLEAGGVLNIQAGTKIIGKEVPTTSDLASTLIITRGAKINATGTEAEPIIFTCELATPLYNDRGLWGGLVILGNGVIADETTEKIVEGFPSSEVRATFGGTNDADNSGILTYVSIRHGGAQLAPGNEINGLTLGAVGSGTKIEHVEVIANDDDGIELFGGMVDVKWAVVSYCGDDAFDYDTGWRGKGQFWFALSDSDDGDHGGEWDGAIPDDKLPFSNPTIYNATFIGGGVGNTAKNEHAILIRDGGSVKLHNSIITDYTKHALQVEDRASAIDSRKRLEDGDLVIANNIWFGFGSGNQLSCDPTNGILNRTPDSPDQDCAWLATYLGNNGNTIEDPQLQSVSRINDGGLLPVPVAGSPAYNGLGSYPSNDNFFTPVNYKGAFGYGNVWINSWTALDQYGILSIAANTNNLEAQGFVLSQNAPNPANGTTNIHFELPAAEKVSMKLFNIQGQEIMTILNNEVRQAGNHFIDVNTANLTAGLYYYTLYSRGGAMTMKMSVN